MNVDRKLEMFPLVGATVDESTVLQTKVDILFSSDRSSYTEEQSHQDNFDIDDVVARMSYRSFTERNLAPIT